jgi:hypothetical protein
MKAWLKGGLIGVGIGLILGVIGVLIFGECLFSHGPGIICKFLIYDTLLLMKYIFPFYDLAIVIMFLYNLIKFFIIGALIGWIVGKIKSKKK